MTDIIPYVSMAISVMAGVMTVLVAVFLCEGMRRDN
jgi:hypothetical protein